MNPLNYFIDWHNNRKRNGSISFSGCFMAQQKLNHFVPYVIQLLGNDVTQYYISTEQYKNYKLEEIISMDFDEIDIWTDSKNLDLFVESITLKKVSNYYSNHVYFSFWLRRDVFKNKYLMLNNIICTTNLLLAYYEEMDYTFWQNFFAISGYKYKRGLIYTKNSFGEKIVDTSTRPGRTVINKYFRYSGSSKMWFGPKIYQYIPQEKILSFEGAVEIKVLEHNITFVNLYETVYDGDEPHNQEVQSRFREHIGIDTIKIE